MVIGITVDEVLRDFLERFTRVYEKYGYGDGIDLEKNPVKDPELISYFDKFKDKDDMNNFLYNECALEVFGHADQLRENLINEFNKFLNRFRDEETEHEIKLISREAINSIPATYFFLSKTGCRIDNVKFVTKFEEKWDEADILITASPRALKAKPENKISVKVNCSYNIGVEADHEIDRIEHLFKDLSHLGEIIGDEKLLNSNKNKQKTIENG